MFPTQIPVVAVLLCDGFRIQLLAHTQLTWVQGFTINPAFPHFQVITLTDPKLINTLLSTAFKTVKIENVTSFQQ